MGDLASLIEGLASADVAAREEAAAELYRLGCARGDAARDHAWPGWRDAPEAVALLAGRATVGIAVEPAAFEKIHVANGSPRLADVPPDQDAKEFELHFGAEVRLDVLTTKAPRGGGAIARFLEKLGEDMQQVEYEVKDVNRATEILRTRFGQQPVYPATRPGANGTRVNFFLTSAPDGKKVLIELVEARRVGS